MIVNDLTIADQVELESELDSDSDVENYKGINKEKFWIKMVEENQKQKMEKTLQISRMIRDIPEYKGEPTGLHNFIEQVADILEIAHPAESVHASTIYRAIRNRITNKASEALELYSTPNTWNDMRNNLTSHFADKRDETVLIQELHSIQQGNDRVEEYFAKISSSINSLKNWSKINEPLTQAIKADWYNKMALNIFVSRLKEPMGSHVRSMRPKDLVEARQICIQEQSLTGLRYQNKPQYPPVLPFKPKSNYQNIPQRYPINPINQVNMRPMLPIAPKPTFNNVQKQGPNVYYNHRPFASQPKQIMDNPIPMDTTSNTNRYQQPTYGQMARRNNVFQTSGPPRWQAKELHNTEISEDEKDEIQEQYTNYETYQESVDEENPIVEIEEEQDFCQVPPSMPDT